MATLPLLYAGIAGLLAARLRRSYALFPQKGELQFLSPPAVSRPRFGASRLAEMSMPAARLSKQDLELWDRRGYAVVRRAIPREAVMELAATARAMFSDEEAQTFSPQHQESFYMRVAWLGLEKGGPFADLVLHRDLPLGGLAAQLLRAGSVRVGNLGMNGVTTIAKGSKWHFDIEDFWYKDRERTPTDSALVRFWLPLWPEEVLSNSSGGSLEVMPLDEYGRYRDSFEDARGPCFQELHRVENGANQTVSFDMSDHCRAWMEGRTRTPNVAIGDVVLYSPKVWHRSQPIVYGNRTALTGNFYDPETLARLVNPHHQGEGWPDYDVLGLLPHTCLDASRRIRHKASYWQSAENAGVSSEPSACFPQVFPSILQEEVADIAQGSIRSGHFCTRWWQFLVARAPLLLIAAHELERGWWYLAPASLHGPTKALGFRIADWLWWLQIRASSS